MPRRGGGAVGMGMHGGAMHGGAMPGMGGMSPMHGGLGQMHGMGGLGQMHGMGGLSQMHGMGGLGQMHGGAMHGGVGAFPVAIVEALARAYLGGRGGDVEILEVGTPRLTYEVTYRADGIDGVLLIDALTGDVVDESGR
jgi:hypothetical protein